MRNLVWTVLVAVLCLVAVPAVHAGTVTVTCPVDVDLFTLDYDYTGGTPGCGRSYPIYELVKCCRPWGPMVGLVRFDLTDLLAAGYVGDDVMFASFKFFRSDRDATSNPLTAPAWTEFFATIHALDDSVTLTEDLSVGSLGVIDNCNRPAAFGPGYTVSSDTGPDTWAEADITQITKDWLDGTYVNNGIEFQDDTDPVPYAWFWSSIQGPDASKHPYLEVGIVPEPMTMILFGTGLVGLLGHISRKRLQKKG